MKSITILGKYLDQPRLVANFSKAVPAVLVAGGASYTFSHIRKFSAPAQKEEKKKEFIKIACVLTGTIGSALLATKGMGKASLLEKIDVVELTRENKKLVDDFLQNNKVSKQVSSFLEKAKTKILKPKEVKGVFEELSASKNGKEFLSKFVPEPELKTSKEIFGEIGRLSVMGLVPVLGGIFGGIVGDKLTEKDWKDRIPNKVKEGSYQYLANIFLCNVGAGAALGLMERAKVKSKSQKALGMLAGIVVAGVVCGSAIANFIGKTFVDPLFKNKCDNSKPNVIVGRSPELLDIGLHIDDVATVGVMSGLRWIEPALPMLYSISGFRAGIGYRNGDKS